MLTRYIAARVLHAMAHDHPLLHLDIVCLRCILSWLPVSSLASAACVCRKWRDISAEELIWGLSMMQGASGDYGRNAAQQLPEVSLGLVAPLPTPPPIWILLRHAARATENHDHAWHCRSVGWLASPHQVAAPCHAQPGRASLRPRWGYAARTCSPHNA